MSNKILVTDSLFIFDEHVKQLEAAGYEVERLDKPEATEAELCEAVKGKVGYILGGIEKITDKVIEAADELKVIAFTGAGYHGLIPGWKKATEKGIAIANAPGGNSIGVAEFAWSVALAMQRNLFEVGRTGDKTFQTTGTIQNSVIGVVGAGNIGEKIIRQAPAFYPQKIQYYSRSQKDCGADFVSFDELIRTSDVIFVTLPSTAGELFDTQAIAKIKDNALIVSISPLDVIDFEALFIRLKAGTIRAAIDWAVPTDEFNKLPLSTWFNSNSHTAYNTMEALKQCSDMSTESIINLLKTGEDQYLVNPEYKK